MKIFHSLCCLLYSTMLANGQEIGNGKDDIRVSGVIIDSITKIPVEGVYVVSSKHGVVSQDLGQFTIVVSNGESLIFSHLGYEPLQVTYDKQRHGDHLVVILRQRIRVLNEVMVFPYDSEEQFKSKVMSTVPSRTTQQEIAKENSEMMKGLGKYAGQFPYTINDRFYDYMKGPQDATFLSSDPAKGFIRAIRNIVNPATRSVNYHSLYYDGSKINPFKVRLNKIDSLGSDSLIVNPNAGKN